MQIISRASTWLLLEIQTYPSILSVCLLWPLRPVDEIDCDRLSLPFRGSIACWERFFDCITRRQNRAVHGLDLFLAPDRERVGVTRKSFRLQREGVERIVPRFRNDPQTLAHRGQRGKGRLIGDGEVVSKKNSQSIPPRCQTCLHDHMLIVVVPLETEPYLPPIQCSAEHFRPRTDSRAKIYL